MRDGVSRTFSPSPLRVGLHTDVAFSGRIRGHALPAGYYRAVFIAANSAGTSALRALSFRIVAR